MLKPIHLRFNTSGCVRIATLGLLLNLISILSFASYITPEGNGTFSVEQTKSANTKKNKIKFYGEYKIKNNGDESAFEVYPEFQLGHWQWKGTPINLIVADQNAWKFSENILKTQISTTDALPSFGYFPLLITMNYKDANGYAFSSPSIVSLGIFSNDKQQEFLKISSISSALTIQSSGNEINGTLELTNHHKQIKTVWISFFTTKELKIITEPQKVEVNSGVTLNLPIKVQNRDGLVGSTYPVYAVLQWDQNGLRNTMAASGSAKIEKQDLIATPHNNFTAKSFIIALLIVFQISLGLLLIIRKFTQRKNISKNVIFKTRLIYKLVNYGALISLPLYLLFMLPIDILNDLPASGGDTGSHFWPLFQLVKNGLTHGTLRVWNPGNLGGEPLLVHYFPFPYLVMSALSLFMPLGRAFNIGTILPVFTFPLSVYACVRGLGLRFPAPILTAALSLAFLYNESNSMWGGNVTSTLAGQFAHEYALNFILLGIGALAWEIRRNKFPWLSMLLFAAVATSHAYVFLCLPMFFLSFLLFYPYTSLKTRFKITAASCAGCILLSLWFLVPMLDNNAWTTPFSVQWSFRDTWLEGFSKIYFIQLGVFTSILIGLLISKKYRQAFIPFLKKSAIWSLPILFYVALYFGAPLAKVINIRALPQLILFVILFSSLAFSLVLTKIFKKSVILFLIYPLVFASMWWVNENVRNIPSWFSWNYSGWTTKKLYPDLKNLSENIKGDFSMPRVIYENNPEYEQAGTMRVFEMLPYFAGRSTLESVYMQSTILSYMVFYLQALVSKQPSCPFWGTVCPSYDMAHVDPKLNLFGTSELILSSQEVIEQAKKSPDFVEGKTFGMWHVFKTAKRHELVEVVRKLPVNIEDKDWKKVFYDWFIKYDGTQSLLFYKMPKDIPIACSDCTPKVEVAFNEIIIKTPCPGKLHLLKFAFHPTWQADSKDPIYLLSPGFMGIVPTKSEVHLHFGQSVLWKVVSTISIMSFLALLVYGLFRVCRKL